MNLQNVQLTGQTLQIDDSSTFNAIGRDVVLRDCILRISVPAKALSVRATLVNCTVVAEKLLKGFSWVQANLQRCTFEGKYKDNEFGSVHGADGICDGVQFSAADLDDCTFYGNTVSNSFASWPTFVIHYPLQNLKELQSRNFPVELIDDIEGLAYCVEGTSAVTYNAKALAKRTGLKLDAIRSYFSQFKFVEL